MSSNKAKWNNLDEFLTAHLLDKQSQEEVTHTTFGKHINGKYHIPAESQTEFLNLYYKHIIKTNKTHNIIERQLIEKNKGPGALLCDVDFRFNEEHFHRQYTEAHVFDLIKLYLKHIEHCYEMDEDTHFPIFVMEKPAPRMIQKPTGNVVKDGIHMIIGLKLNQSHHQYIQKQVVDDLPSIWGELPIVNTGGWEDVIDGCIPSGQNGWLLLNSKKRDDESHYKMTQKFDVHYDTDESKWVINTNTENLDSYLLKNHKLLSPRFNERPTLLLKSSMIQEIQAFEENKNKPVQKVIQSTKTVEAEEMEELGYRIPSSVLRSISNRDELEACLNVFLDALQIDSKLHEMREAYEYVMILPESYYGDGSYDKWVRVGMALRNINVHLLIVWIAFSARSRTFSFSSINELCDKWTQIHRCSIGGITKQSLMYWAKSDAAEKYDSVRENTIDYWIDMTIDSMTLENMNKKKNARGNTESDIAEVLYQMKKGEYVSSAYKQNEWYRYCNHRWMVTDSGVHLRRIISGPLRDLYRKKANSIWEKSRALPDDSEERTMMKMKADKVLDIAMALGSTKEKENIMKEAREKFYDEEFLQKLDQDKYLLGFNNGVVDFRTKTFRRGYPEDYISKSTNIDYVPLDPSKHQSTIEEIEDYMTKLFPEPELCNYMWDHLASVLIGDTALNQCLHYYTGVGSNGKSILVKLMQMILGDYAVEFDVKFFTQERTKLGGTSSELHAIIGARYAITAEPSEGDKMNEGPMKQLTSGTDKMSCRAPFGQQITFTPQASCIIMANHFLEVRSTDHGTWRRIRVVDFKSLFTDNPVEGDPHKPYQFKKVESFDEKFTAWAPIFLSMLVDRAFKTGGIVKICPIVQEASNKYRNNQDIVAEFMNDRIVSREGSRVSITEIQEEFQEWFRISRSGGKINKRAELQKAMDRMFTPQKNTKGAVTGWIGCAIEYEQSEYKNTLLGGSDANTTISDMSR